MWSLAGWRSLTWGRAALAGLRTGVRRRASCLGRLRSRSRERRRSGSGRQHWGRLRRRSGAGGYRPDVTSGTRASLTPRRPRRSGGTRSSGVTGSSSVAARSSVSLGSLRSGLGLLLDDDLSGPQFLLDLVQVVLRIDSNRQGGGQRQVGTNVPPVLLGLCSHPLSLTEELQQVNDVVQQHQQPQVPPGSRVAVNPGHQAALDIGRCVAHTLLRGLAPGDLIQAR